MMKSVYLGRSLYIYMFVTDIVVPTGLSLGHKRQCISEFHF